MSKLHSLTVMIGVVLTLGNNQATAQPLGTAFTYQGELRVFGTPLNDSADFECTLWNESTGGEMVAEAQTVKEVEVIDGLFQLVLDFGAEAFDGDARWLQIAVRSPSGVGEFTTMQPRQPLTATPYSIQTRGITVNDTGDRVGIGTTTPAAQLHVSEGSDAPAVILIDSGESDSNFSAIDFSDRGTPIWGMGKDASNDFYVDTSGEGRRLTVEHDTGRVGIGTATPSAMLDVTGAPGVDGIRYPDGSLQTRAIVAASNTNLQIDFDAIQPGIRAAFVGSLPGAMPGDMTLVNTNGDSERVPGGLIVTSTVPAPNQIRVELTNYGAVAIDPPLLAFNVMAIRP